MDNISWGRYTVCAANKTSLKELLYQVFATTHAAKILLQAPTRVCAETLRSPLTAIDHGLLLPLLALFQREAKKQSCMHSLDYCSHAVVQPCRVRGKPDRRTVVDLVKRNLVILVAKFRVPPYKQAMSTRTIHQPREQIILHVVKHE